MEKPFYLLIIIFLTVSHIDVYAQTGHLVDVYADVKTAQSQGVENIAFHFKNTAVITMNDLSEFIFFSYDKILDVYEFFDDSGATFDDIGIDFGSDIPRSLDEYDIDLNDDTTPFDAFKSDLGTRFIPSSETDKEYGDAVKDYLKENGITYNNPEGSMFIDKSVTDALEDANDGIEAELDRLDQDPVAKDMLEKLDAIMVEIQKIKEKFEVEDQDIEKEDMDWRNYDPDYGYDKAKLTPRGDPGIFSLDGEACMNPKREMGQRETNYWQFNLFATENNIKLAMDTEPCDGTYVIATDIDNNGMIDNGEEILFSFNENIFEMLYRLDLQFGNNDGFIMPNDQIWDRMYFIQTDNMNNIHTYTPEDLGIIAIHYGIHYKFDNDSHGIGVYADNVNVSNIHYRINSWTPIGIITDTKIVPIYGAVMGALWDCTTNDVRYHVAEKQTGDYLRINGTEDPTYLYEDALDFCDNFEKAHMHPDKYLSHWVAGIASMEHKKSIETGTTDMEMAKQSEKTYERALKMSPDNPFYNTDYCLLQYHMGDSTTECIGAMNKAIEDRPDVEWFVEARDIALRGSQH